MVELVAHRGAPSEHPENSLAGFQKAYDLGVRIIEFDVQMTRDKELIVFHDRNTKRMTNQSMIVEHSTYADLSQLPLLFQGKSTSERIPRLQDVLLLMRPYKDVKLIVDCKTECQYKLWRNIPYRIHSLIKALQMEDRVMYASGTIWTLAQFRALTMGKAKTILNVPSKEKGWIKVLQMMNTSRYVLATQFADDYSFPLDCEIPVHLHNHIKKRGGKINAYSLYHEGKDETHIDDVTFRDLSQCVDRIMTDDIRRTLALTKL